MAKKSAVSIFRQKILGPGKSEHSGRGFYIVETALSADELVQRMKDFAAKKPEMVESLKCSDEGNWELTLKKEYGSVSSWAKASYYRTLVVSPKALQNWGGAIVPM